MAISMEQILAMVWYFCLSMAWPLSAAVFGPLALILPAFVYSGIHIHRWMTWDCPPMKAIPFYPVGILKFIAYEIFAYCSMTLFGLLTNILESKWESAPGIWLPEIRTAIINALPANLQLSARIFGTIVLPALACYLVIHRVILSRRNKEILALDTAHFHLLAGLSFAFGVCIVVTRFWDGTTKDLTTELCVAIVMAPVLVWCAFLFICPTVFLTAQLYTGSSDHAIPYLTETLMKSAMTDIEKTQTDIKKTETDTQTV